MKPIDLNSADLTPAVKNRIIKQLGEDELVYFVAEQQGSRDYLLAKHRIFMHRTWLAYLPHVAVLAMLPGIGLAFLSSWWLLLCLPGVALAALYAFIEWGSRRFLATNYNGTFVITNKAAKFISCAENVLHDSTSFKLAPSMITSCRDNADGTSMIDFSRQLLQKGQAPADLAAWQYVPLIEQIQSILKTLAP